MRYQFASGPQTLPFSSANVTIGDGSVTTPQTRYFAIVGENPAGINKLSAIVGPIAIGAGQGVTIAVPTGARPDGAFWQNYIVAASTSADATTFVQVAKIAAIASNGAAIALPVSITLDTDAALSLSAIVSSPADLPVAPVQGMLRAVSGLSGNVFEYDSALTLPANGQTILEATEGAWIYKPGSFSAYVTNTTDGGGCDRAIELVANTLLRAPRYTPDGAAGPARYFWIVNDDTIAIPSGLRVGLNVTLNDVPQGDTFDGLLGVRFYGYANTTTGALRTTYTDGSDFDGAGLAQNFENRKTDLFLPDDLQPGEAYAIAVYPDFSSAELNNQVADGSVLKASPFLFAQAGEYVPGAGGWGDSIYARDDRGWVVPQLGLSAIALKRSSLVNQREAIGTGPTPLLGFTSDTPDQKVAINGNGAIYLRSGELETGEALRALVSTAAGVSVACNWSDPVSGAGGLSITCTYPSNGTVAPIRANYPDTAIAGLTGHAKLNAPYVTIYVKDSETIRAFSGNALLDGATQTFTLEDWSAGTTIEALPTVEADFCLFEPVSAVATSTGSGGTFPNGVQVAYAFEYNGAAISKIRHDAIGCIHVASMTLAEMESATQLWSLVIDEAAIADIPQAKIYPWQTRRTIQGKVIYYNPVSTATADNTTVWKPSWKADGDPGRWLVDGKVHVLTGTDSPTSGQGEAGDVYLQSTGANIVIFTKIDSFSWEQTGILTAPTGATGQPAYSATIASYTQPAVSSNVTVSFGSTAWMAAGMTLFIELGGYYTVISVDGEANTAILQNLGYSGNTAPTIAIASGRKALPGGLVGAAGSPGSADSSAGLALSYLDSPPDVAAGKTTLYAQDDDRLYVRRQSNGAIAQVALTDQTQVYSKPQAVAPVALVSGPTVAIDAGQSLNFSLIVDQDITIANPSNLIDGATYTLRLEQDATGGHAIAFQDQWRWESSAAPDLSASAGKMWIVRAYCEAGLLLGKAYGWYTSNVTLSAFWPLSSTLVDAIASRAFNPTWRGVDTAAESSVVSYESSGIKLLTGDESSYQYGVLQYFIPSEEILPDNFWKISFEFSVDLLPNRFVFPQGFAIFNVNESIELLLYPAYVSGFSYPTPRLVARQYFVDGDGVIQSERYASSQPIAVSTWYTVEFKRSLLSKEITISVNGNAVTASIDIAGYTPIAHDTVMFSPRFLVGASTDATSSSYGSEGGLHIRNLRVYQ